MDLGDTGGIRPLTPDPRPPPLTPRPHSPRHFINRLIKNRINRISRIPNPESFNATDYMKEILRAPKSIRLCPQSSQGTRTPADTHRDPTLRSSQTSSIASVSAPHHQSDIYPKDPTPKLPRHRHKTPSLRHVSHRHYTTAGPLQD